VIYFDKKLTWQTHIKAKRRQLELKIRNMNWLINKKIITIPSKQNNHIQGDNKTSLDLWDRAVRMQQAF
jgi:hypothetical protein